MNDNDKITVGVVPVVKGDKVETQADPKVYGKVREVLADGLLKVDRVWVTNGVTSMTQPFDIMEVKANDWKLSNYREVMF